MLRDLGDALVDALAESPEVSERLREIQRRGYTLYLRVDCKQDSEGDDKADAPESAEGRGSVAEPVFKIDSKDLSFLRSIGIDPTRKSRSRRS